MLKPWFLQFNPKTVQRFVQLNKKYMKKLLLFSILLIPIFTKAQIEVGTNTSSANAVLDVNSTNKGLILPRLNNTAAINSPTAGLIIYDKATKAPAYHDGKQWNSMMMAMSSVVDPN